MHTKHEMHISWSTSNTDSSSHIDISNEYIFSSLDEAQRQMELLKHAMYAVYNPVFVWTRCAFTWHWRRSATTAFHHMQWRNHVRPTTIRMTNKATNATLSNEYYWESIMHTRMDWGVSTPEHLTSVTQKVEQTLRILIVMLCHWLARARVMNHTCKYILLFTVANRSELILFIYKLNTFLPTHRTNWLIPHCHRTNKFLTVNVVRGVTLSHSRFT